jgi:ABC-type multidrug transport system ATPase subunit
MRLTKVSFRYARRGPWILREVSLDLPAGSVAEVVGRNGAGKSTLLRLLAGVTRPSSGGITGRPGAVGYAPEVFPAGQPFTVAGYLRHVARIRRASGVDRWVSRLGLTELMDVPLGELSKGSAHKVGLVQALLAGPGLLILDEPFAGLDKQTRAELPAIVAELAAAGGRVVVSDHQNALDQVTARWTVRDGRVSASAGDRTATGEAAAAGADAGAGVGTRAEAVIEVVVDAGDAEAVERKLRADGYRARIRGTE